MAEVLGKPESYVTVRINPDQVGMVVFDLVTAAFFQNLEFTHTKYNYSLNKGPLKPQ